MSDKLKIKKDAEVEGDLVVQQDLDVKTDAVVRGDLTIEGSETFVDTTNLDVSDSEITINKNGSDATAEGAGVKVERDGTDGKVTYDSSSPTKFKAGDEGSEDNLVGETATQTLTNKTIDAASNSITGLEHGSGVDNPSSGVHGVVGNVVGDSDSQTLTNKTIDADNNTISNLAHGSEVDNPSSGVHGVVGNVVGTSDTQTLTNKTIDGASNTLSNLTHGSQVDDPSSGVHGVTGSVVGTTDIQVLTNKDFDGGVASDSRRVTLPSDTKANLDGLTRKEGTVVYATDLDTIFIDDGSALVEVSGSGGSGGINHIADSGGENFNFEDSTTTGWQTYDDGSVESPIDGDQAAGSNISLSVETGSFRIRGNASGLLGKPGVDCQGEGWRYDYTAQPGDVGKTQNVDIEYTFNSSSIDGERLEYTTMMLQTPSWLKWVRSRRLPLAHRLDLLELLPALGPQIDFFYTFKCLPRALGTF